MRIHTFLFLALSSFLVQDAWAGQTYYLNELKATVLGGTKEEVRSRLGKPNIVKPTKDDEAGLWQYGYADKFTWGMSWGVIDEETGLFCWIVKIEFEGGRAVNVSVSNCKE